MKTICTKNKRNHFRNTGLPALVLMVILSTGLGMNAQNYEWAKGIGGTSSDYGYSVAVDGSRNTYSTGTFRDTADFDPSGNTANLISTGESDIFLAKYDDSGNYIWAIGMGSSSTDYVHAVIVDNNDDIYITGSFSDTVDFDPSGSTANLISAGSVDIFLAKYDAFGNYIWAKSIKGPFPGLSYSVAVDDNDNVYLTGAFRGTMDFDPSGALANLTATGDFQDIFLAKYDASGNYLWAKSMGGTSGDYGHSVKVDGNGNAYVTGFFQKTVDFDPSVSTANLSAKGGADIFLAKYDVSGNYLWAKSMGGISSDYGYSLDLDASGNAYVTVYFKGTVDFDPSVFTANLTSAGEEDIFLAKYNSSGNYVWAKRMGGASSDEGFSVSVDGSGNAYITGHFEAVADFDPSLATVNLSSVGFSSMFLAKYNAAGSYLWAKAITGAGSSHGRSVLADDNGSAYLCGYFFNTVDFDPSVSTANLTPSGQTDVFVAKYSVLGIPAIDTALTLVSDNSWKLSTVVTTATANKYPWTGVVNHPTAATFTLPVVIGQPFPWEHILSVEGSEVISSLSGVTYYRNTFDLLDPVGIQARFRMFVDDNMQIFINGQQVALEEDMSSDNRRTASHDLLFNGDGTYTNGNNGGDNFDYVTVADMDNVFTAGTNEIVLAIRNRTSKPDVGGFSFRMDLDKGAVKKAGSVGRNNSVATADSKLIIFPNPTSGNLTVVLNHTTQTTTEGTVSVFDFSGKQIISQSIYSETELNLNSLPAGVYLVKVTSGAETFTQKVVKQ